MKTAWYLLEIDDVDYFKPYDALPIGCVLVDTSKVLLANQAMAEMTGYKLKELLGISLSDLFSGATDQLFKADTKSILTTSSGSALPVLVHARPQEVKGGDVPKYILTLTPFQQESQHDRIIDLLELQDQLGIQEDGYYVYFDHDYNIIGYNASADHIHNTIIGKKLSEVNNLLELYGSDGLEKRRKECYDPTIAKGLFHRKIEFEDAGHIKYIDVIYKNILNDEGQSIGILEYGKSVTDLVKSNLALHANEKKLYGLNANLKAVLESTRDGMSVLDRDYKVMMFNEKAREEFKKYVNIDLKLNECWGDTYNKAKFSEWREQLYDKVLHDGETIESVVERKEHGTIYKNIYTPVKDDAGKVVGVLEVSRDMTEDVKKDQLLKFNEKKYRSLLEDMPIGVLKMDTNSNITYLSPYFVKKLGYNLSDVIGKPIIDFIKKEDVGRFQNAAFQLLNDKKNVYNTFSVVKNDGTYMVLEGTASLKPLEEGEGSEFFIVAIDGTEKLQKDQHIKVQQENYNSLFANINSGIIIYDMAQDKILGCNKAALQLYSVDRETLVDSQYLDYVPEVSKFTDANLHDGFRDVRQKLSSKEVSEIDTESVIIKPNGEERLVGIKFIIMNENDDICYVMYTDKTEINYSLKEIREKSSVYEALIKNSFEGIEVVRYELDDNILINGNILIRNNKMLEIMSTDTDTRLDSLDNFKTKVPEYQPNGQLSEDMLREVMIETIRNGASKRRCQILGNGGGLKDLQISHQLIEINNFVYLIKNFREITEELRQQKIIQSQFDILELKNEELKKYIDSNLQLENFAYIASHDLKAPIRSVISFAQLLRNNSYDKLGEKDGKFLDIIITASTNMQVLIDDLLAFSRINTQQIEFEEVEMPKLLNHLLIEINQSIAEKDGEVNIISLPEKMTCDASRLRQVFQNLITNAMKFHKEGETPYVEIDFEEETDFYKFRVTDRGIGIEQDYHNEVFLMFKKLYSENKYKGTGIGLSICKKIIEQHQGDIWLDSTVGEGSSFYFTVSKKLEVTIL